MKKRMKRAPKTAYRILAEEAIVINFDSSFFYNLNPVGTFIWERCDGSHSIDEIAAALAQEYEVEPEEAARDCREFIQELLDQGLLELMLEDDAHQGKTP
jgi:hypothetical protein